MHKNNDLHGKGSHGIAAGFVSAGNSSITEPNACNGFVGSVVQVEEMADSPTNGTIGSSGNSEYQSRIPPPGPFDPYMPDASIGLSPQVSGQSPPVLTPGSTSNSDSYGGNQNATAYGQSAYGQNRNPSYSEQRQSLADHSPSFMYDGVTTQPNVTVKYPGAIYRQQNQSIDNKNVNMPDPAKAFTDMDAIFDLPTPSEFNAGMTPGVQDFGNMTYGQQTNIPVRNNGDTSSLTDTPGSWNLTGGTGMTPNFNDMGGVTDWDNLMDGLAEWDPSQLNDGLIPSLD